MKNKSKIKKFMALGLILGLAFSPLFLLHHLSQNEIKEAEAADYSGISGGFTHNSDGSITANFTVTNNDLNMKGWLLCLFDSKPSIDSNNKLTNSNNAHPYSYTPTKHYFFASNTKTTGSISVTWAANAADQKQNWSASTSTGAAGKTLNDYLTNGTNWHLIIGPRHYNTSWGDSGIGEGTNGYWENCDYYVGKLSEVFPEDEKTMSVNVTSYQGTYNGNNQSININVTSPTSDYTIKYRTSSTGSYNLTNKPTYKDVGNYTIYFQITASGYTTYEGSGTVKISKATPTYTAPSGKTGLIYNEEEQTLINAGSSNVLYSLDNINYSSSLPRGKNAGNYIIYYKVEETSNYTGIGPYSFNVSIAKADASFISLPNAKTGLKYTGEPQELINAGTSTGGTVMYSLDGEEYSENIPTKTLVGTYVIYYKIEGDTNYNGVSEDSVNVIIHPNDKTALITVIDEAKEYLNEISSSYGYIAYLLNNAINDAELVKNDDNKTVSEIEEAASTLNNSINLAHAQEVDYLIEEIGEVRYHSSCLNKIIKAEEGYDALSAIQKELVENYNALISARNLYNRLNKVAEAINAIGEVTYNEECFLLLKDAKEALNELNKDEINLIPTLFNELNSDEDIYEALKLIATLGDVRYNTEFFNSLTDARNTFDALDHNEQKSIYNYDDLLKAEETYRNVDRFVNLVNDIPTSLEYVGPHDEVIDKARNAYDALTELEKSLVPELKFVALTDAENEYEELKIEHERKEIEDREAGVTIALEGASGIPHTVAIDINNAQKDEKDFSDNIDLQTIQEVVTKDETISSFYEIKLYEEKEGQPVELSLEDIDEDIVATLTLDIPNDVDISSFKIILLDEDNNIHEVDYTMDSTSRMVTINTKKLGTFAFVNIKDNDKPETEGLAPAIVGAVAASIAILGVAYISIFKMKIIKKG